MVRDEEKHLFTLRHIKTGELHRVLLWKNYGVVCPTLWTTNGNFRYTARQITDGLSLQRYEVVESSFEPSFNFADYVALSDRFSSLHKNWSKPQKLETQPEPVPESGWVLGVLKLTETE